MFLSNSKYFYYFIFLIILIIALTIRLPELTRRPMHTDEAVHAVKFGELLENNYYRYDKNEYHGPTLYYFTLISAWIQSSKDITKISETTLRIVPVFFGILLLVLLLFLKPGLSRKAVIAAGFLTAISPMMVFYSRYYIQEILLVFFSFAVFVSGYRYIKSRHIGWVLAAGIFLGLMHATKETCIIAIGSMLASLFLLLLFRHKNNDASQKPFINVNFRDIKHIAVLILSMLAVSAFFYSSFFTNPSGIADSYLTFGNYFNKASNNNWHIHPWYYYLKMIIFSKDLSGPVWTEVFILLLAGAGFFAVILKKGIADCNIHLLRFILFYTGFMMLVYSVIPYKTPWNMLGFFHGLIILAGVGAAALLNIISGRYLRIFFIVLLAAGSVHLVRQSFLSNYKYYADPSNPYVYGHTSDDIFRITDRVKELAEVHPEGNNMFIEVVCPENDYWPLPWYLRDFPNTGWWNEVNMNIPAAQLIIASPDIEPDIIKKLYEMPPPGEKNLYVPLFNSYTELRPMVELRGYVVKELWDKYLQNKK
ncbi:flippase activity-associated protein Agl23 [candidate division KSB1 bacterium]